MTVWTQAAPRRAPGPLIGYCARDAETVKSIASIDDWSVQTDTWLPGLLKRTIRRVVELHGEPMTAFEISRQVLRSMPNRWSARTVEKAAGCRAGLEVVDLDGLSPQNVPCSRYRLGAAS